MQTLAIETSCDDTSIGIISYDGETFNVEELLAYSQIQDHQKFWGVLPEIASRLHSEKIIAILQKIWRKKIEEVDLISVTTTPGLPGSLVVGKAVATMLSEYFHKPLLPVNHIHGHIFSILLERKLSDLTFPLVILTASGGHNDIYLVTTPFMKGESEWNEQGDFQQLTETTENKEKISAFPFPFSIKKIGYTLDDASGEAFDKVSKMLWGPYPGGPRISQQALNGKPNPEYQFKRIFLPKDENGNYLFSFSGMKSQVSFLLDKIKKSWKTLTEQDVADIAYEFQEATIETLANRLFKAVKEYEAATVAIAGGVSANNRLVEYITALTKKENEHHPLKFIYPAKKIYSTDNWAMIGVVGFLNK